MRTGSPSFSLRFGCINIMWLPPGANRSSPRAGTTRLRAWRMRLMPFSTVVSWIIAMAKSGARTSVTTNGWPQSLRSLP